ncbi:amyloid-beta A4 precursor protein-binding family A member 2 isoform X4 [Hydra vulgaris]|uniref:amyloid-beta A4 precursor protein-binding family A member 2 isoform X4 n=1 Tax=Hydra vulgaris TaxID=6087 RepID=UPI001F5FB7C9|nr:amyloid-beta A4 precursor protein-binding family A member 2 isoform X2 [Hydra vulgaris]
MSQKLATKFENDVNKSLLFSESESEHEYTDIFEDNRTGKILANVSFEDGESKSASDDEIVAYTGDIETYIGSNNEESDCDVHSLLDEQLIDFTSEGNVHDKVHETVIDSDQNVQESLSRESKEINISETALKLLDIKSEKNLRPGKPVLVKSNESLVVSDAIEQSKNDHKLISKLEDVSEKKSLESFDPLSTKKLNENSPSNNSSKISDKQSNVTRSSRKRTRHRIYLDDPDIHQLIIEQVDLLRRKIAAIESKQVMKSSTFHSQSNQTTLPNNFFRNKTKNDIPLNPVPANISTPKFQNAQQNLSVQFKGQKNRKGQNLISRIRNQNFGSEDDDEYTERMAKALHDRNSSYEICPDCGEYHSQNEDDDDDDVCPDCGVRHNPYQHSPIKNGVQHPRDEMEDNLPSIEGPLSIEQLSSGYRYKLKYLGSCQVITKHPVTKETRLQQAQDAYKRIKAQDDDEEDASTNVDMCISLERIKIINKDTKFEDVMMDHALRTICFICDMGKILVLMARRLTSENSTDISFEEGQPLNLGNIIGDREKKSSKNICHVFKGVEDTSTIAKAIGQAFNIAYRQFLKSSGIAHELVEEAEYSHVLESQIIVGQDLENLTNESAVREVVVVKKVGDPLGIMLLESGWGSMLPTVFVAHIANYSATAQCQKISVGDHILACDGTSLVGLSLSECTTILKNCRNSNKVTFRVVTCPTVVDVVLLRPDVKYQLGFSVQEGTICSMLRGGIAERAGVRVGHRIIEINGDSVVAKSHQYIVDILAYTIGSISMKTMPIALYRLMVGEELPQHV